MVDSLTVFVPEGMEADEKAVRQIETCLSDKRAVAGALMADHHLGYSMPIGGVVAYDGAISPSGVGFDIACGNKAVKTPLTVRDLSSVDLVGVAPIMQAIQQQVAFGVGRTNDTPFDHTLFDTHSGVLGELDKLAGRRMALSQKARAQLGTVGSGNHYVDLLADEDGYVWVANHFGSRGLGHTIATGFLNLAAGLPFDHRGAEKEEPTVIGTDTDLGQFYLDAMRLAGDYAYAGRDYVIDQVLGILGTVTDVTVHNHHNYAWLEDGLWVVRKGATPLTTDLAFIGGSMGDGAVIVRGKLEPYDIFPGSWVDSRRIPDIGALHSAPHGSGRVMSRTKAAGKFKKIVEMRQRPDGTEYPFKRRVRDESTAAVNWQTVRRRLADQGIVVLGSGADEAPEVYKPLDAVIAAHPNIGVVHRLRPLGVVMAGEDTYDPYKD